MNMCFGNPIRLTDLNGRYPDDPGDRFNERDPAGNGMSLVEHVVYDIRGAVTSGVATLTAW